MTRVRSILFLLWLYGTMIVLGAVCAPLTLMSRKNTFIAIRAWARATRWGLRWICGIRIVIDGLENVPKGPLLIAAKHQSMIDTILPALFLDDPAIVAKSELFDAPLFGWYLTRAGMYKLDRGGYATALKSMMRAARKAIAEGRQFIIFPEGTRQELQAPPDYKPGIAALYRDLNVACVPIALNTGMVWPAHGIMRFPGTATLRVLPAIAPGLSRDDFMRELETAIETESQNLLPPNLRRIP